MRVMHMLHSLDAQVGELGSTVRMGHKWFGVEGQLILCVCSARCLNTVACDNPGHEPCDNCDRQGTATVQATWSGLMRDVPARMIEHEHEVRSRQYSGLLQSMRKAYGDDFAESAGVTVVLYRRDT